MRGGEEPPPDSDTWRRTCDEPVSIDQLRAMTAAEALELVGPVGLDEVYEKDPSASPGATAAGARTAENSTRIKLTRDICSVRYVCSVHTGGGTTWAR